jgi:hypothetical protein
MLDINGFFARFDDVNSSPNLVDLQPIKDFLVGQGAKFAIDTELSEVDEVLIKGLLAAYGTWNWEMVFECGEYHIAQVPSLNVWLVDFWQDGSEEKVNTWFV